MRGRVVRVLLAIGTRGETHTGQVRLRVLVARVQLDDALPQGDRLIEVAGLLRGQRCLMLGGNGRGGILSCNRDARGDAHLRRSLEQLRDDREDLLLGRSTLEERHRATTDESNDRGNGLDLEGLGNGRSLVNVHLNELEGTRMLARDLLKHGQRGLRFERARRPHDHDDRHGLGGGHDVLEVLLIRRGNQRDVQPLPRGRGRVLGCGRARACRQVNGPV